MVEFRQEKIAVPDLVLGMFVARLDRPWVGTPFPIQGFHIKTYEEIRTLGTYCRHVYVDVVKSRVRVASHARRDTDDGPSRSLVDLKVNDEIYETSRNLKQEIAAAASLHDDVAAALDQVMAQIAAGRPAALPATRRVANKMVDSIVRNPDASIWIARIRNKDAYTYGHSVRASIWAITFGRHLGLSRPRLNDLALGVLLSEVGKTRLPSEILTKKERLSDEEFEIMKRHVEYGIEILKDLNGITGDILAVVRTHHERHNGSGYPQGLRGDQIPLSGKIAGIVDCYDALTRPRHDEKALSPADAMARLHDMRNEDFQGELVEEFIQAIGIYPTGSLIELSTGEVGVITEQNSGRRLRPKVMVILDQAKQPLRKLREIDLLSHTRTADGRTIDIVKSLPEGAYGIDLENYRKNVVARFLGLGNALFRY